MYEIVFSYLITDNSLLISVTCKNAIASSNLYKKNSCRTQYYYGSFIFTFLFGALYQTRQFMGDRSTWSCLSCFLSIADRVYFSMADT